MMRCSGVAHPEEFSVITRRGLEFHLRISGMHIAQLRYFAHMENSAAHDKYRVCSINFKSIKSTKLDNRFIVFLE